MNKNKLTFGDLIRSDSKHPDKLHMITDRYTSGLLGGFVILDAEAKQYGMPGTIEPDEIIEFHGSVPHDDAVNMTALSATGGVPMPAIVALVQQKYPRPE